MKKIPEKGDVVTFGRNKQTGDRSYCEAVWKVTATNETHVRCEYLEGDSYYKDKKPIFLMLDEYDFSLAEDFI